MDFKEFLKKNIYIENSSAQSITDYENGNVISVQVLGEWAWNNILSDLKKSLNEHSDTPINELIPNIMKYWFTNPNNPENVYWKMAVACLGEKEIQKRLEAEK